MKKLLLGSIVLILSIHMLDTPICRAQSAWRSLGFGKDFCLFSDSGIAVLGKYQNVSLSTDDGNTWAPVPAPSIPHSSDQRINFRSIQADSLTVTLFGAFVQQPTHLVEYALEATTHNSGIDWTTSQASDDGAWWILSRSLETVFRGLSTSFDFPNQSYCTRVYANDTLVFSGTDSSGESRDAYQIDLRDSIGFLSTFSGANPGLLRTTDHGSHWSRSIDFPPTGGPIGAEVHSGPGGWFADIGADLYFSRDTGRTWESIFRIPFGRQSRGFGFNPRGQGILSLDEGDYLYASKDSGLTWHAVSSPFENAKFYFRRSGHAYALSNSGEIFSANLDNLVIGNAVLTMPRILAFGSVHTGEPAAISFTLRNAGDSSLRIDSLGFNGAGIVISPLFTSIPAGDSAVLTLRVTPKDSTDLNQRLFLHTNTPTGTEAFQVTGTVIGSLGVKQNLGSVPPLIYPNPSSQTLHVNWDGISAEGDLVDQNGRTVLTTWIRHGPNILTLNIPRGSYYLLISGSAVRFVME